MTETKTRIFDSTNSVHMRIFTLQEKLVAERQVLSIKPESNVYRRYVKEIKMELARSARLIPNGRKLEKELAQNRAERLQK